MIIVVEAEVRPVIEEYSLRKNPTLTNELLGMATAHSGMVGSFRLDVLQVAESPVYKRHYSGPTQSGAVAALVAKLLRPDLVINFGTSGGFPSVCKVGDVLLADACLFLDRLRFKNVTAFEWGMWGGNTIKADKLQRDLELTVGTVASQIQYSISDVQAEIVRTTPIACVDMEAGPIAQVLNQGKVNLIVLKVISNGIYRDNPMKQEEEYHDNRAEVSRIATKTLLRLLAYLDGKRISDLAGSSAPFIPMSDEHPSAHSTTGLPLPSDETERYSADARRYALRGVSSDKGEVHAAIKNMDKGLYPKAFCKVVPDLFANDSSQAVVMHADGAGTKSSLAYIYWKKTGDLSVWKGIAQDSLVMNLDDLLCAGITGDIALSSTIGRNKHLIPKEVIASVIRGTAECIENLRKYGVSITLAGGETADVGDLVRTIIVDSTVTARIPRSEIIDNSRIRSGDVIVGLSSFGQATYEDSYNSGIGSNGLTSARHDTFEKALALEFPETFDPMMRPDLVYSGNVGLTEPVKVEIQGASIEAGKLILSPTRTYAPIVRKLFDCGFRKQIHGMVHCSGGGQTKVLHFIDGLHVVKDNLFRTPPVFHMIQKSSSTPWAEMYKVFNMGHRMEIYTDQATASSIIDISRSFAVDAQIIGRVEASGTGEKKLTIQSEHGRFEY